MNARQYLALASAAVALGGGLALSAPTASASQPAPPRAQAAPSCPERALCLWQHSDFSGRRLVFRDAGYWQHLQNYDFNRRTSSYWNRRGDDAAFQSYAGVKICIESGERSSSMGSWNDAVSSIYLAHTDNNC